MHSGLIFLQNVSDMILGKLFKIQFNDNQMRINRIDHAILDVFCINLQQEYLSPETNTYFQQYCSGAWQT